MTLSIGILAAGAPPATLADRYAPYGQMLIDLVSPSLPEAEFRNYDVYLGEFPETAADHDGWIISGSKYSVYADLPWIATLQHWVVTLAATGKPLVGICFGHQMLAQALGGRVEKYTGGWGVGTHEYQLVPELAQALDKSSVDTLLLNAVHQDQVVSLPEGASVLATSEFCVNAVVDYGQKRIVGIQAHPEFHTDFEIDLLTDRGGESIPLSIAEGGLANSRQRGDRVDNAAIGVWLGQILRGTGQ